MIQYVLFSMNYCCTFFKLSFRCSEFQSFESSSLLSIQIIYYFKIQLWQKLIWSLPIQIIWTVIHENLVIYLCRSLYISHCRFYVFTHTYSAISFLTAVTVNWKATFFCSFDTFFQCHFMYILFPFFALIQPQMRRL